MVIDPSGIVRYRGAGVNTSQISSWIDNLLATSIEEDFVKPRTPELSQNYPNPFNPSTAIRFDIDRSEKVILQIYNNEGRLITTLIDNHMNAGSHEVSWNSKNDDGLTIASGVYYYILKTDGFVTSRKMTFIR